MKFLKKWTFLLELCSKPKISISMSVQTQVYPKIVHLIKSDKVDLLGMFNTDSWTEHNF
jgi:hypothetical protein